MNKSEIETKEDMLRNFTEWSIYWWIVVFSTPASIWLMTNIAAGEPLWIGWKWTIVVYIICLVLYVLRYYQFNKDYRTLSIEKNGETPRT